MAANPFIPTPQLQQLQQQINALSPSDSATVTTTLANVYGTLQDAGFAYAGWGKGVVEQNTIAGISAMFYLDSTTGQSLTQPQINKLKIDLAEAYLKKLHDIANGSLTIGRDIDGQEVWEIHKKGYTENGLPISSWTLDAVFQILFKNGGMEAVEGYWADLRNTEGDYLDAMIHNINTWRYMQTQAETSDNPEIRELAREWLEHVPSPLPWDDKTNDVLREFLSSDPESIKEMRERLKDIQELFPYLGDLTGPEKIKWKNTIEALRRWLDIDSIVHPEPGTGLLIPVPEVCTPEDTDGDGIPDVDPSGEPSPWFPPGIPELPGSQPNQCTPEDTNGNGIPDWLEPFDFSPLAWGIDSTVNSAWGSAHTWFERRDPLVLDLDGDGIETTGINGYAHTVLFDHDSDGVKTGTGWVKGDDAFLALDRNGNGAIDNGGELFGVDTVLANGKKAANGFAALADLDSNGDGNIDAQDEIFDQLRIWRDLDQDGVSDPGELQSLADAGIASIGLDNTATHQNLAGGNVLTAQDSYTKTDGTTGTTGEFTTGGVGNLDLAENPFYSEFTDTDTHRETERERDQKPRSRNPGAGAPGGGTCGGGNRRRPGLRLPADAQAGALRGRPAGGPVESPDYARPEAENPVSCPAG
jgi:hypothetical protein